MSKKCLYIKPAPPSKYKYDVTYCILHMETLRRKSQDKSRGASSSGAKDYPSPVWTPAPGEVRTNSKDAP